MSESLEARIRNLEDHKAILELKAAYCNCVDGGWGRRSNDGAAVADLFVADGIWDLSPHGPQARGSEAIRAAVESFASLPFIIHNVMNPIVSIDGDAATGQWHAIFCMNTPENRKAYTLSFAIYDERYVRTDRGWRFAAMKITPAGAVPLATRSPE